MGMAGYYNIGAGSDDESLRTIHRAIELGVTHIDTSDFYGPHVTNRIIREALHPYPDDLVIVTKIGAKRGKDDSWLPAFSREELTQAVHDNLRNLRLDVLDVVNLRSMFDPHHPVEGSLEAPLTAISAASPVPSTSTARSPAGAAPLRPSPPLAARSGRDPVRSGDHGHRQRELLPADGVHLLADDGHDLVE